MGIWDPQGGLWNNKMGLNGALECIHGALGQQNGDQWGSGTPKLGWDPQVGQWNPLNGALEQQNGAQWGSGTPKRGWDPYMGLWDS